jgi:hypothetical protein
VHKETIEPFPDRSAGAGYGNELVRIEAGPADQDVRRVPWSSDNDLRTIAISDLVLSSIARNQTGSVS